MSVDREVVIVCDGCGDRFHCGYEYATDTRDRAYEEGWRRVRTRIRRETFFRDLCPNCLERGN